jgi:uncharacterized protein YndB with AHSA1/START domain
MSRFVYVTFIRATPAKVWEALTEPPLIRRYWFGAIVECSWARGSPWKLRAADGTLLDQGEIVESDPPRRLVIRWTNEWKPDFKAEGPSRCTIDLEPVDSAVKLTLTHEMERDESRFIAAIGDAWPVTLSNLKSLLETGEIVVVTHPGH